MRFVADECVDAEIVARLRERGHEVVCIAGEHPGLEDEAVLDAAGRLEAVLLTADKDFGQLVFRWRKVDAGVILLRLAGLGQEEKATVVLSVVSRYGTRLRGAFTVISETAVRIRREPYS